MDANELNKLEQRKKELELEIKRLQEDVDVSIGNLKDGISDIISPRELIRRFPLKSLGLSMLVGFILVDGGKKKNMDNRNGMKAMLGFEMKRIVTQKLIGLLTELIENTTQSNQQKKQ